MPWQGGHEVPACFDQANRFFFKYGGCGDPTPPIHILFPKGDSRHPNGYSNTCWIFDLARARWDLRRPYDASWPVDRPANGCSRNYCYDSNRKVIWMYGGISDGGGGGDPWDLWTYDAGADRFTKAESKNRPAGRDGNAGDVIVYDPIHDLVIMPRGDETWVYKPTDHTWEARKSSGVPPKPGHYASMTFDLSAGLLVYPVSVPTGRSSDANQKPPGTSTTFWRRNGEQGYIEQTFTTWLYEPALNKWEQSSPPADQPRPSPRWRFGLTYDSKNQIVFLIGGSTDTWDQTEKYFNDAWVFHTMDRKWEQMKPPAPLPHGGNAWRDCRQCAYDEADNVIFWQPCDGRLWAYRYK